MKVIYTENKPGQMDPLYYELWFRANPSVEPLIPKKQSGKNVKDSLCPFSFKSRVENASADRHSHSFSKLLYWYLCGTYLTFPGHTYPFLRLTEETFPKPNTEGKLGKAKRHHRIWIPGLLVFLKKHSPYHTRSSAPTLWLYFPWPSSKSGFRCSIEVELRQWRG